MASDYHNEHSMNNKVLLGSGRILTFWTQARKTAVVSKKKNWESQLIAGLDLAHSVILATWSVLSLYIFLFYYFLSYLDSTNEM